MSYIMEHIAGIEPAASGLASGALPLSHMRDPGSGDQRYTGRQYRPCQARTHELDPLPVTGKSPGSGRLGLAKLSRKAILRRHFGYRCQCCATATDI